jgi:hypothetical protein
VRLEYLRRGRLVAYVEVPGRLLTPAMPHGLTLDRLPDGVFSISEPPERSLAGRLTVPYVSDSGAIGFADLIIPTSGRFTQADLTALWLAGKELSSWRARLAQAATVDDFAQPEVVGAATVLADWRSLVACAGSAADLLSRWPTTLDRQASWLPVGVPGGVEDLEQTERQADRRGHTYRTSDGLLSVSQSFRWSGRTRPVMVNTVALMSWAVLELVGETTSASDQASLAPLLAPVGMVAAQAEAGPNAQDPDPSSWPPAFHAYVAACHRVLAELKTDEQGSGAVPLLDTYELYEAWLAIEVRDRLDALFGPSVASADGALAAWELDAISYELWLQPSFKASPTIVGAEAFVALVADELRPDLLLSASRGAHTELLALDAKAWSSMQAEDALSQSAKYLYGIRRADDIESVPALASVNLVTSAIRPSLHATTIAAIDVMTATPTAGLEALSARLIGLIERLGAALEQRERDASSR